MQARFFAAGGALVKSMVDVASFVEAQAVGYRFCGLQCPLPSGLADFVANDIITCVRRHLAAIPECIDLFLLICVKPQGFFTSRPSLSTRGFSGIF